MRLRRLCLSLTAVAAFAHPLAAAEDAAEQPTPEYLQQRKELEEMLSKRDLELFELQFVPGNLDRVVLTDRRGRNHVFNYLTFTVRNQATLDQAQMATRAKGYNEVLQAIAQQYENAKVDSADGVKLTINGVQGKDGVILERTESKPRTRTVSLTALAYDEHGTRIRLLDEPPGSGPQESFAFPDLGDTVSGSVFQAVKEKVEEAEGRKLLTVDELRKFPLPPFDGVARVEAPNIEDPAHDTDGWLVGEAHGVILFTKLSDYGHVFTLHINGLCNKLRFRNPAAEAGKPENYFEAKVMRRTWVLEYSRPGDEFYRDLDRFNLVRSGYQWVDSFQRIDVRRTIAYSRYFLANITSEKGSINAPVKDQFWPYYQDQRATYSKLPDLQAGLAAPK